MALDVIIGGANLDANGNVKTTLPATQDEAGFATVQFERDAGAITGTRYLKTPYVSEEGRLSVGIDTTLAVYNFTPTAQNTGKFKHAFTTMTMTQSAGFLNINPALATVSGNYAYLQSWRHFNLMGEAELNVEMVGQITAMPPTNQILEIGLFLGTAGVAPADGVFFRLTSAGLAGVISYNGVETSTGVFAAVIPANDNGSYRILISQREVSFWIDDVLGAEIDVPAGNAIPYLSLCLPLCLMMRNSGTVTGGTIAKIGTAHVTLKDLHSSKPWSAQMANQNSAYQGQDGDTQGQLAIWANAASPTAVVLTNTTAAFVGLGGIAAVTLTLAAGTDGIIFSYQNPVGSLTQPPKTLVITSITIDSVVSVVLAATALVYAYAAAFGHTAVSLATAETGSFVTATTKAPRRVALGMQGFLASAAVGTTGKNIFAQFDSPIVVHPGEFFAIIAKTGIAAPATGVLTITAMVDHYFE